ncbi:hypothetical protein BDR22DRAFT_885460 [Usnea florida]
MQVSNPLDLLEVFLRNPRVAPNLETGFGVSKALLHVSETSAITRSVSEESEDRSNYPEEREANEWWFESSGLTRSVSEEAEHEKYPRLLQIEGCDQREHFEMYPQLLQIEGCDEREHFELYPQLLQIEGCDEREHFEMYPQLLQIEGCDQRERFED